MFQIDNSTAVPAQPPSTAPGTPGYFTDGNPATNLPATIFPAEFANAVMLEINNVIAAAGIPLNKAAFNQLLTAIQTLIVNDEGAIATPPQFDNSQKAANTAWVKANGFSYPAVPVTVTGTQTLTNASLNNVTNLTGTGPYTVTLPAGASSPVGTTLTFVCSVSGGITLATHGSDMFSDAPVSSRPILPGDTFTLMSTEGTIWWVLGGSASLAKAPEFASSLGPAGYQKLPSGLIIQWGSFTCSGSGFGTVTLPIACPNALLEVTFGLQNTGPSNAAPMWNNSGGSKTGFNLGAVNPSGAYLAYSVSWISTGY
jgi:hypothetical protein